MMVTVHYREAGRVDETFHDVTELVRDLPGAVLIRSREYRGTRTTIIPWQLIARIEAE